MKRTLSLAHLTAIDVAPPELIYMAADVGFDAVGLRLIRVTDTTPGYGLMTDPALMRATKSAISDTGLAVNDIEFVKIDPMTDVSALSAFLDAGAELGASEVICAPYDPDHARLIANLSALSEAAQARGLGVSLEFFPWTDISDLTRAAAIVQAAGDAVGILVDALHFNRSNSTLEQLRAIAPHRLRLAHLCDAMIHPPYTTEELLHTARAERLPVGQGQIDLQGFLTALPPSTAIGLEIPMGKALQDIGPKAVLKHIKTAYDQLLDDMRY